MKLNNNINTLFYYPILAKKTKGAIFRVQPKYEYAAQSEFNKYSSSKAPDSDKLEKYEVIKYFFFSMIDIDVGKCAKRKKEKF